MEELVRKIHYIIIGSVGLLLVLMTGPGMAEKSQTQDLQRAVIKIDSLSCGGCFSTINAGLAPLEGYTGMGANLFRKLIAIDFAAPLTKEKIFQKLTEIGYPGKIETIDAIGEKESFAYLESRKTGFASNGGSCCSGGTPASNDNANKTPSGLITTPGGSCCTLPGVSQPTKDL